MRDPRGQQRPGTGTPGGRRVERVTRRATPSEAEGRGRRSAAMPQPRRGGADRARAIFAVVALVVIISLLFGTVAYGLDGSFGRGDDEPRPPAGAELVPTYEAQLRENPNDVQTMAVLANILQNRGDYPGAIALYERAVALKPDDLELRVAFGQALASYGQRVDAEVQYRRALELNAQDARVHYYLGRLYERWDPPRPEEARLEYGRAAELEPEGSWGRVAREALARLNATPTP